jgi:hypothetical protein
MIMWNRLEIKNKAKAVLKKCYWQTFLVSIVLSMVTGGSSSGGRNSSQWNASGDFDFGWLPVIILAGLFAIVFAILFKVFIGYAIEVGARKFMLEAIDGNVDIGQLGYTFKSKRYGNIVKTMFIKSIMLFGWFLLLIIPGIIKSYAYRMVPYILAENPDMNSREAIDLSEEMTRGQKMDIFILDLSFIGWWILGAIAFGIGVVFVMPYYNMTHAVLYTKLKEEIGSDRMGRDSYYERDEDY